LAEGDTDGADEGFDEGAAEVVTDAFDDGAAGLCVAASATGVVPTTATSPTPARRVRRERIFIVRLISS
jgi:hypothetical protein